MMTIKSILLETPMKCDFRAILGPKKTVFAGWRSRDKQGSDV